MYARFKPRASVELYARTSLDLDPAQRHQISEIASEDRRGRSLGPWHWEAIRRERATGLEVQAAEHDTAWQARRGDCIYTILEIPDAITFSAH